MSVRARQSIAAVACAVMIAACGSGDDDDTTAPPEAGDDATTTTSASEPLRILVTNDDGVSAAGIDVLVEAVREQPDTELTVVAPAADQSGTGSQTTPGPLTVTDATTAGGYAAKAVTGFPADTIVWALDQSGITPRPHLVVSGMNEGQNLGTFVDLSGTVGAARAAAARGVPALAVSQGLGNPPDYARGAAAAIEWIAGERDELLARDTESTDPSEVVNLNIPTCPSGSARAVVDVPLAGGDARPFDPVDCTTPFGSPASDVEAFLHGYIPRTVLPLEP
jgi:5'-nucleotidase